MIQIKKILAAVDFSEHTDVVLRYAAEISRAFGSEVTLCHIIPKAAMLTHIPPVGDGYFPPNFEELQREAAQQQAEEALKAANITGAQIRIEAGTPFVEVVRQARHIDADLIIVGTHGRGAIAHVLLGSVAENIVRKAPCPVLTVRKGEHEFVMP